MGEVVWLHSLEPRRQGLHEHWPNVEAWLPSLDWIVVVLLCQCNAQFKIGLSKDGCPHHTVGFFFINESQMYV